MKTLLRSFVVSALQLSTIALLPSACGVNTFPADDSPSDGDPGNPAPTTQAVQPTLPFVPSNIAIASQDLSQVADDTLSQSCSVDTDSGFFDCAGPGAAVTFEQTQSDGSTIRVFAFKSLTIPQAVTMTVKGSEPAVFLAFGDMTIAGHVVGKAVGHEPGPGGATIDANFSKGAGAGGGPAAIANGGGPSPTTNGAIAGIAAGGGSFCGLGGQGAMEADPAGALTVSVPLPTPVYGNDTLVPLVGGSSGGTGGLSGPGAGGGALQFVAAGTFSLEGNGSIDVGGGGGWASGETWASQEAAGGGSGGAVLIEAMTVNVDGTIEASGGAGGGHTSNGSDANVSKMAVGGAPNGGNGSAPESAGAYSGEQASDNSAGAGGGGAGRIRINTNDGLHLIGTLAPAPETKCTTAGSVTLVAGADAGH